MLDYAAAHGFLAEDTVTYRDLFDTKIMSVLMPRPSEVIRTFWDLYNNKSAQAATDYYYRFSQDTNYIRADRIAKDEKITKTTNIQKFKTNNVNSYNHIKRCLR